MKKMQLVMNRPVFTTDEPVVSILVMAKYL